MTVLRASHITKTFSRMVVPSALLQDRLLKGAGRRLWSVKAVDDVSLELHEGEWLGIYGGNGSGKTTLLRILAGLMVADEGEVRRDARMACFFDLGAGFHLERTADENIFFHGLLHGMESARIRSLTGEILEFAGVQSHADLPLKCYSTGMRLRLAFAVVAHIDTDAYLWDEVAAVGDQEFQRRCVEHLRSLKESGKAGIIVSHSLGQLEGLCDRILFMEKGAVVREQRLSGQRTAAPAAPAAR